MTRPLTHANLMTSLSDFFPSLCTIQTGTETQSSSGFPEITAWPDFAGHVDIPCRIAPANTREPRTQNMTYSVKTQIVLLRGYYPTITSKMRAVVDSVNYNIIGTPEYDDQNVQTRLTCEVVA